jgi:hypothetical protein
VAVVGLSAVGVDDKSRAPSHMARRASALCAVFFLLALLAGSGSPARRKAANGLGALITLGYLATEHKAFTALGNYFAHAKVTGDKPKGGVFPSPSGKPPPVLGEVPAGG